MSIPVVNPFAGFEHNCRQRGNYDKQQPRNGTGKPVLLLFKRRVVNPDGYKISCFPDSPVQIGIGIEGLQAHDDQ